MANTYHVMSSLGWLGEPGALDVPGRRWVSSVDHAFIFSIEGAWHTARELNAQGADCLVFGYNGRTVRQSRTEPKR